MLRAVHRAVRRGTARDAAADAGSTLAEVVVSLLVFALIATGVAGLVVRSASASGVAARRTTAANLAERQKEYLLSTAYSSVVAGTSTVTGDDGVPYTVSTAVTATARTGSGSGCDSADGAGLAYKRVTVQVTWPRMGAAAPVRTTTLRPIPATAVSGTLGQLTAAVRDQNGDPVSGTPVTLLSAAGATVATVATDDAGCALFPDLAAGTYSARVDVPGWVGVDNQQTQVLAAKTAAAGRVGNFGALTYAPAASLRLKITAPGGYTVPPALAAGVRSTSYGTTVHRTGMAATGGGTVTPLFPTTYTAHAGQCADPSATTSTTALAAAGSPPQLAPVLGRLDVTLTAVLSGLTAQTVTLTAQHDNGTGCDTGEKVEFAWGVSNAVSKTYKVALPPGSWRVIATSSAGSTTSSYAAVPTSGSASLSVSAP